MFVQRHFFGPALGLLIAAYLYVLDPAPAPHLWVLIAALLLLFAYPILLRISGLLLTLSLASMQHVVLVVFYCAYHYGGAQSPFLCWIVPAPLGILFYISGGYGLRACILAALVLEIAGFYVLAASGVTFPEHIPAAAMGAPYVLAVLCAVIFVSVMAIHYSTIVAAQQRELRNEVEGRHATEARLRDAKDEAERASRAKSEFLAKMSHELRTPLNAIIGFSQIIAGQLLGPVGTARYAGYAADIERSGQHLLQIISEILDLTKIETGKFVLHEHDVDLLPLVQETIDLMRPLAENRGLSVTFEANRRDIRMRGDDLRIKQILLNVLSNATKFTEPSGQIKVSIVRELDRGIVIAVTDTGIGIPAADLVRVLEPFEQVGTHAVANTGGTGLGLPLARELSQLHGGTLVLESEPGRGTTVKVSFPEGRVLPATTTAGTRYFARQYPINAA